MDRNTVIGFVLLALLFFGYFYYTRQGQMTLEKDKQLVQDSINRLKPKMDSATKTIVTGSNSSPHQDSSSTINQDTTGKEQFFTLENKVLKITFTPKKVKLEQQTIFNIQQSNK